MRYFVILVACLCAITIASSATAKAKADSVAFQGSLNDASDKPVPDGPRDLTLSVWTDSVGGTMLHSSIVTADVLKGVFSTCIGCGSDSFFDIFTEESLYLQIQIAGELPMAPRTVLRNTPRSLVSARVRGDISTTPGNVAITGDPDFDLLRLSAGADSAKIRISGQSIGDPDFDLLRIQGGVGLNSRGAAMTITGDPDFDLLRMSADADSAKIRISAKIIGDPDFDLLRIVGGSGASHLTMRSAPGGMSGSTTGTIRMQATPDSAVSVHESDADRDGIPEASDRRAVAPTGTHHTMLSRSGSTTGTIRMQATPDSTGSVIEHDQDGDGLSDQSVSSNVTPTGASMAIKTKGTGAQRAKGVVKGIGSGTNPSMMVILEGDLDGDGHADYSLNDSVSVESASRSISRDLDADGLPDHQVSSKITPTSADHAINTKGTGAQAGRVISVSSTTDETAARWILRYSSPSGVATIRQMASPDSAGTVHGLDLNGDGVPEISANVTVPKQTQGATFGERCDMNNDGTPESQFEQTCTPDSVFQKSQMVGATGSSTVWQKVDNSQSEIRAKRTAGGATGGVVLSSSDTASSITIDEPGTWKRPAGAGIVISSNATASSIAIDEPGAQIAMSGNDARVTTLQSCTKPWGTGTCNSFVSGDSAVMELKHNGSTTATIRMQANPAVGARPIEHSSGAHLTSGGVWTNASDAGLKENFQPVDGHELLEKIDELPINQWNYKVESDEVTHIGPTAQDFQKVFGVGENDKTISTIDPSGIALAAIKELNNQNRELKEQNARLKKQLDDLAKKVEKLASRK